MTGKKRRKNDNDKADDNPEHDGSGPPDTDTGTDTGTDTSLGGAKPAVQERQNSALVAEL
jgi:hypothetical protein